MTQPGPIQPGSSPIKGQGESSDEIKKGKFKEELQKVQKISKTDEDSQAKKKKKQEQEDLEEDTENGPATDTPPQGFTLHETQTTSVYDTQEGSSSTKQIDQTSPSSQLFSSTSNQPAPSSKQQASSSPTQTSSSPVEKNTQTPSSSSPSSDESINTQEDAFTQKAPSANGPTSLPNDETVLEKLKKEIKKLEKQILGLEEKDKETLLPILVKKQQALIQKSHLLEQHVKKQPHSIQEKQQQVSFIGDKKTASEEKAPHSSNDKHVLEKEKSPESMPSKDITQEAFFEEKTPLMNKQTPLSATEKKQLNPDEKVEALLKKQAKEKKKKIEPGPTDQNTDPSSQQTAQIPLNPLQMAPPMPETPPASGTLSPKMHELFQTMVGLVLIKNLKTEGMEGTQTEVTLNNPEYAHSPFYNLKIVITEYQTAPGAYNIELQGNSWQNTLIAPNIPNLLNAFVDPRSALPFTVNRLEVTIKKEEVEKRAKKVQSTTSGQKDFDDTPG